MDCASAEVTLALTRCANNRWWLENPHASIIGKPSAQLAKTLVQNELERVKARREKLGKHGLTELNRLLEQAQHENDNPVPQERCRGDWKDVTTGHESIGPNLILLKTEVKNYVATSGLI